MLDRTGAAFLAALQNLNELSERLAIGRENDDYLHRLANAAQNVAIAAREVYAEAREKDLLCSRKSFSRAGARESIAPVSYTHLDVYKRQILHLQMTAPFLLLQPLPNQNQCQFAIPQKYAARKPATQ